MFSGIGVRRGLLAAFFAGALALPALAAGRAGQCYEQFCTAQILVGPEPVTFSSAERFHPARERLVVRLLVDGTELRVVRRDGCRTDLRGAGISARVETCGASTPVVLRASRSWGGSVPLEVRYRARRIAQGVKGVSAASGESGGAAPPSGTGGISAP